MENFEPENVIRYAPMDQLAGWRRCEPMWSKPLTTDKPPSPLPRC